MAEEIVLLEPKEIEIETLRHGIKKYTIHTFPAFEGREIVTQYPISGIPKIGDYLVNADISKKMLKYVTVQTGDIQQSLKNKALINSHVPDAETLLKLEYALMEYNTTFFKLGKASTFLDALKIQAREWTIQMLIILRERLSAKNKQRSKS